MTGAYFGEKQKFSLPGGIHILSLIRDAEIARYCLKPAGDLLYTQVAAKLSP